MIPNTVMTITWRIPVLFGLALALVLPAVPADAQVTATVVTKTGERHTGRDLGYRVDRGEVAIRTSLHEQPRLPVGQVAYVDFGGTPDVKVDITGSQEALVMRDGRVTRGQVIELGHENPTDNTSPFLVVFRDEAGQEHRMNVNQVGRIYFAGGASAVPTTGVEPGDPASPTITVQSQQQWTPTGMNVRAGERVTFKTTGEIRLSDDPNDIAIAAGSKLQRYDPRGPMPNAFAGALIGRIGTGQPFAIGNQTQVQMPATGQLFLGINDSQLSDNQGSFQVQIQRGSTPVRRR